MRKLFIAISILFLLNGCVEWKPLVNIKFNEKIGSNKIASNEESIISRLGASEKILSNDNAYYYYAAFDSMMSVEKVARLYYKEYRHSKNEFQAKGILERIRPQIEREISRAKNGHVFVPVNATLGGYDFTNKGFALNLPSDYSFKVYDAIFQVSYGDLIRANLSMNAENGEKYLQNHPSRHVHVLVESQVLGVQQGKLKFKANKLHVLSEHGELIKSLVI